MRYSGCSTTGFEDRGWGQDPKHAGRFLEKSLAEPPAESAALLMPGV